MTYHTTAAYLSGAICGHMWWPVGEMAGTLQQVDLRREFARMSEPANFRDVLLLVLSEHGGDFQDSAFTADTVIRIERRKEETRFYLQGVHVEPALIAAMKHRLAVSVKVDGERLEILGAERIGLNCVGDFMD